MQFSRLNYSKTWILWRELKCDWYFCSNLYLWIKLAHQKFTYIIYSTTLPELQFNIDILRFYLNQLRKVIQRTFQNLIWTHYWKYAPYIIHDFYLTIMCLTAGQSLPPLTKQSRVDIEATVLSALVTWKLRMKIVSLALTTLIFYFNYHYFSIPPYFPLNYIFFLCVLLLNAPFVFMLLVVLHLKSCLGK